MTNRLLSILVAAALTCFALALRAQRKSHSEWELDEYNPRIEANIPGYSFSRN
jgi:hypothetical protein